MKKKIGLQKRFRPLFDTLHPRPRSSTLEYAQVSKPAYTFFCKNLFFYKNVQVGINQIFKTNLEHTQAESQLRSSIFCPFPSEV